MPTRPWIAAALAAAVVAAVLPAHAAAVATAPGVTPSLETPPLFDDDEGGNADADDPAIWVDHRRPARSLVIATAKDAGVRVYDLGGRELQSFAAPPAPDPDSEPGRFNNVDVVYGVRVGYGAADLAIVTDRGRDQLRIYRIDPLLRRLVDVTAADVPFLFSKDQDEVNEATTGYGLAAYTRHGTGYAVASRRHTSSLGLFRLQPRGDRVGYQRVDTLALPASFRLPDGTRWQPCDEPGVGPQVEGMTVDGDTLYAAQEDVGLWRLSVRGDRLRAPSIVDRVREYGVPATYDPETEECTLDWSRDPGFGGTRISADVEGLTIYDSGHGRGYLLVSSQGDSTFLAYDRRTNRFLARFAITDGPAADGAQHSDGTAVVSASLGRAFPGGLLVVHDGENTGAARPSTNFKYVDWRAVARLLPTR
jgi:3-phytase